MNSIALEQRDYILLLVGTLLLFAYVHRRFWHRRQNGKVPLLTWLLVLTLLACGWPLVEGSAGHERARMRQMMEGYAPTYAQELGRMGHAQITPQTSEDEPRLWQMIEAQKRWLSANPLIRDVYTMRKRPDGRAELIVDSETDFDRNGRYEGAHEQRSPIGTIVDRDLARELDTVFAGRMVFQDIPTAKRGSIVVSALVPIRDFRGDVEAALGADFDASTWAAAIHRARLTTIGYLAAVLVVVAGGSALLAHQIRTRDLRVQLRQQEGTSVEKEKLEMLVNSIDGIVWEADARTFRFSFVSQQSERMLGYPPEKWMTEQNLWRDRLHPENGWAFEHRARMVAEKVPYSFEYRMTAADGQTVWIRESAGVMLGESGEPLLVRGVFYDITAQKRAMAELEEANKALVDSSRYAGMAEVATGVLHNVGNVLNSVNISGTVISDRLRTSKVIELGKVAGLLTLHAADFAGFVASDPRGPHVPELISRVAEALRAEHTDLLEEVDSITRNIGHIKEIVSMQQGFAKGEGIVEPLTIQALVDDAIKINSISLARHRIAVVQAYEEVPQVQVDKHLVLQILVNLLRNAKQAIESSGREERRVVVKIQGNGDEFVRVTVQDTGSGIAPENLTRIFSHGFTTKKTGHGFGLHSSALAATGMGGALSAHSDGPGKGAVFSLDLPIYIPVPAAVAA